MKSFFISKKKNSDGEHELHLLYCDFLPYISNREYIGIFKEIEEAKVEASKKNYSPIKVCTHCCQKVKSNS